MRNVLFFLFLISLLNCTRKNWERKYDINNQHSDIKSMVLDLKGNVFVAGSCNYLVDKKSSTDWWIKKIDTNGNEDDTWEKRIDGRNDGDSPRSIAIDNSGNIIIGGYGFALVSQTSRHDWWIKKYNQDGVEDIKNWNKKIDGHDTNNVFLKIPKLSSDKKEYYYLKQNSGDIISAIVCDNNDNVYVAGFGENLVNNVSFDTASKPDWWIKKFNNNGVEDLVKWNKKIDGYKDDDIIRSVALDKSGNLYVVGSGRYSTKDTNNFFWWIKKFSPDGKEDVENWNKQIFGTKGQYMHNVANAITIDHQGYIYIAGVGENLVSETSGYDWWIKKFSPDGKEDTTHWNKKFDGTELDQGRSGDDDEALAIAIDSQNNVYVAGYGMNLISPKSSKDWWVKKFDQNGTEDTSWEKRIDGNGGWDVARAIAIDKHDNVYVAGYGSNIVSEKSKADWWIMKFGK